MGEKNTAATLDAIIAEHNGAKNGTVKTVKNGTVKTVPVADTTPVETVVQNGTVKTADLTIPGFSMQWAAGKLDDTAVKATVVRDTTNPWYGVVLYCAARGAGYLTITREADSKEKAPTSRIWAAILRAQKLGQKGASKLTVRSGVEKGTWYLVRNA